MFLQMVMALILSPVAVPISAFVPIQPPCCGARRALDGGNIGHGAAANGADAIRTNAEKPIVVFGASGGTGRLITKILADGKHHVRAVSRRGSAKSKSLDNLDENESSPYVSHRVCDVRQYDDVLSILQEGASGVIWAVTCSGVKKGGGDAGQVDYKGAYHTAKACLACNVPKLAFVSAACVTRPNALGTKAVNWLTQFTYGDMPWSEAKLAGEKAVRDLYNEKRNKNKSSYVIVRPAAALSDNPPISVSDLMVLQGDLYSSADSISRSNVANVVVSALLKGKATDFTTFEVCPAKKLYKNDDGNILDLLCWPSMNQTTEPDLPNALIHRNAPSYQQLFDGLVTDEELRKQYPSIVSDYRGFSVEDVAAAKP